MLTPSYPGPGRRLTRASQRGIGMVEMMVGLALGLFIIAGGLMLFSGFTVENRRLLEETRLVQDLRASADLVTRDLRRAGYWDGASAGVWTREMVGVPPTNAYKFFASAACDGATLNLKTPASATGALCYTVAQTANATPGNDDRFGFALSSGVLYAVQKGSDPRPLSDPRMVTITDFVITPSSQTLDASKYCTKGCTGTSCPEVVVREFEVLVKGHRPGDTATHRFVRSNVRVRNDYVGGVCPV